MGSKFFFNIRSVLNLAFLKVQYRIPLVSETESASQLLCLSRCSPPFFCIVMCQSGNKLCLWDILTLLYNILFLYNKALSRSKQLIVVASNRTVSSFRNGEIIKQGQTVHKQCKRKIEREKVRVLGLMDSFTDLRTLW